MLRHQSALLATAVIVIALSSSATASTDGIANCSIIPAPAASSNYYSPPQACIDADPSVRACLTTFQTCASVNVSDCNAVSECMAAKLACLEGTVSIDGNCTVWLTNINNAALYLAAGGAYRGSTLEAACFHAACSSISAVAPRCPVNLSSLCSAPNFDPATRAPGQAKFSITFGGQGWVDLLNSIERGSTKYKELEVAVTKGLARLLAILEYLITILDMRAGSLVVDFIVNDNSITVDQIRASLRAASENSTLASSLFTELARVSGLPIEVTGFGVEDPSTPAPSPPPTDPSEASCDSGCVAGVIVGIIAFVIILAIITVMVLRKPGDDNLATREPVEATGVSRV